MIYFNKFNKTLKFIFLGIPNLPFVVIIVLYLVYNIYKHTGIVEMEFFEKENTILNDKIYKHIEEIYPKHFRIVIAVSFWTFAILSYFNTI